MKIVELCPHCEEEVKIEAVMFELQKCPKCGGRIRACSMCDSDICDCAKCEAKYTEENL